MTRILHETLSAVILKQVRLFFGILLAQTILSFSVTGDYLGGPFQPPEGISCYSCASEEYEPIYIKTKELYLFGQPMQYDRSCDQRYDLESFAPTIRCESTCVTVLEPQYFGGVQNEKRPYTFVRGCATDIFALVTSDGSFQHPPAEIDYLHRSDICLWLPVSELWPELAAGKLRFGSGEDVLNSGEMLRVCSCTKDLCNSLDATDKHIISAASTRYSLRKSIWLNFLSFNAFLSLYAINLVIVCILTVFHIA